jgi:hypothetical protein
MSVFMKTEAYRRFSYCATSGENFVTPFRDTMILPIRTEVQMNGIGGAHSKMVSPLILSFLDADGQYEVLHFQCVFLLETFPIPLFATGPCEQQGWGFSLNASSPCATLPDGSACRSLEAESPVFTGCQSACTLCLQ